MKVTWNTDNRRPVGAGVDVGLLIVHQRLVAHRRVVASNGVAGIVQHRGCVRGDIAGLVVGLAEEADVVDDHVAVGCQEVHGGHELKAGAEVGKA